MLESTLFSMFVRYYFAVLYNDASDVKTILSKQRIKAFELDAESQTKTTDVLIASFVAKQRGKILRIPYQPYDKHCLSSLGVSDADGAISIQIALGESEITKPIYFVKEDQRYSLNILHPFASSRYLIKNRHGMAHNIKCKGGSQNGMAAYSEVRLTCDDDCGNSFSGTWFEDVDTGRHVQCDYNTYGWDAQFNESGVLECHDNC